MDKNENDTGTKIGMILPLIAIIGFIIYAITHYPSWLGAIIIFAVIYGLLHLFS